MHFINSRNFAMDVSVVTARSICELAEY